MDKYLDQLDVMGEAFEEMKLDNERMREALNLARIALADIANSDDMTLAMARKKAKRIYRETAPK